MVQMEIRGRMEEVMDEDETFWFLFEYFRDHPGPQLPILQGTSAECYDLIIFPITPRGRRGMIDGFYLLKEVGQKLADAGIVKMDSPDDDMDDWDELEDFEDDMYLQHRAR